MIIDTENYKKYTKKQVIKRSDGKVTDYTFYIEYSKGLTCEIYEARIGLSVAM
jgi:hypothetical protein